MRWDKREPSAEWVLLWGMALLLCLSLVMGAQDLPLRDYRESRFAQLGWEMIQGGDWLIPHLNGTPYLNKPPMVPWMVALCFKLLGKEEISARIPSLTGTLAMAICVGLLVSRMAGARYGILGACLLLGSPGVQYMGRMLSSDVPSSFFMSASLVAFIRGVTGGPKVMYPLGFAFSGLSVMSKGLTGLIYPVGAFLIYLVMEKREKMREIPWGWSILVFLAITAPWFLMAELREPGFLRHHFLGQQVSRVASLEGSGPFVAISRGELLLAFLGFLGPLAFLLPWSVSSSVRREAKALLWIFFAVVMVSVMISRGRNYTYLVPALPAVIALTASGIARPGSHGWKIPASLLMAALSLASFASAFLLPAEIEHIHPLLGREEVVARMRLSMALVGVILAGASYFLAKGRLLGSSALMAAVMLPGGWMLCLVQEAMAPLESRRDLGVWISQNVHPSVPIVVADPSDVQFEGTGGWNFYSGRRILMVRFQEREKIVAQAPRIPDWIISPEELLDMVRSQKAFVLAATPKALEMLTLPMPLGPPVCSDSKFQLWTLGTKAAGRDPSMAPFQTGKMSLSITSSQEG